MKKININSVFILILSLFGLSNKLIGQQNVMISNTGNPAEPSIAINPNNVNQIIAGANLSNVYRSNDGGQTWTSSTLASTYGVWGDPTIICDNTNNFYYFHLSKPTSGGSWLDRIVCQKNTNAGTTWSNGTFTGLNGAKNQDKEWAVFDNTTNNIYVTWTEFDVYGSSDPAHKTRILFSKSTDVGVTWTAPQKLNNVDGNCVDGTQTVEGAVPTVGPAGEIYVSWTGPNGIVFKKSTNQGNTWTTNEIPVTNQIWDFSIPGVDRCNGLPITSCDISKGPHRGTIYVNWSDQRNGVNDTDIFLAKSTDGGNTWSAPLRVNNDVAGKHQFLSWMTIDQTNGYIYIVFYDRRNYNDNQTDVYLAYSTDGGITFTNTKISATPFTPTATMFFGDYSNIAAHNGVIRPIWGRQDGSKQSIWTALITQNVLSTNHFDQEESTSSINTYPNPSVEETYFAFKLYKDSPVSIKIYDVTGKEVLDLTNNKNFVSGKHVVTMKNSQLSKGIYTYIIKSSYYSKGNKLIIE